MTRAHEQFRNSPGHFNNAINPDWTRVGFGFYVKGFSLYVTVMFSTKDCNRFPVTDQELSSFERQMTAIIINKDTYINGENPTITNGINNWLNSSRSSSIFNYINVPGPKSMSSIPRITYRDNLSQAYSSGSAFRANNPSFTKIGVGAKRLQGCEFEFFVVYAN